MAMMDRMIPHWLENMLPHLSEEGRAVFAGDYHHLLAEEKIISYC